MHRLRETSVVGQLLKAGRECEVVDCGTGLPAVFPGSYRHVILPLLASQLWW